MTTEWSDLQLALQGSVAFPQEATGVVDVGILKLAANRVGHDSMLFCKQLFGILGEPGRRWLVDFILKSRGQFYCCLCCRRGTASSLIGHVYGFDCFAMYVIQRSVPQAGVKALMNFAAGLDIKRALLAEVARSKV
jgi:hypothetical protein